MIIQVNPMKTYLDPADEILLEEDLPAPQDSKRFHNFVSSSLHSFTHKIILSDQNNTV